MLTPAEEAIVVAFRQETMLPPDDMLGRLRDTTSPTSAAARCTDGCNGTASLVRRRTKRPTNAADSAASCAMPTAGCTCSLAIDGVSKFTYVEFHERIGSMCGVAFFRAVAEAFPTKSPPCSPTIARSI